MMLPAALTLPRPTGDWGADNAAGRAHAEALLGRIRTEQAPYLLGYAMREAIGHGEFGGVEAGFCHALALAGL